MLKFYEDLKIREAAILEQIRKLENSFGKKLYLFTEIRFNIIIQQMFQTITSSRSLKTKLLLLIILAFANSTILPVPVDKCLPNQIYTKQLGCIQSCTSEEFKKCGDVFITLWDPKYCAYTREGKWVSYTFSCQACKNADVLGVGKGACEQVLPVPQPPKEQTKPPVDPLPPGDALPGVQVCGEHQVFVQERGCIKACTDPYFKTCKDLMFIQILNPQYCGFTKNGQSKSATFQCQICGTYPDTQFIGVSKGICKQDIADCKEDSTCQPYEFCDNGKCNDNCARMDCLAGCEKGQCLTNDGHPTCKVDEHCFGYEVCDQEKQTCVDKCDLIKCEFGCERGGVCLEEGEVSCKEDTDCKDYEYCHPTNKVCSNWCTLSKCTYGCVRGNCLPAPVPLCKADSDCKQHEFCNPGTSTCLNKCALAKCTYGCINGVCQPPPSLGCKANTDCKDHQACDLKTNKCYDACITAKCALGCLHGGCIQPPEPVCKADSDCKSYEFCDFQFKKCQDKCALMRCNYNCEKGTCTPPPGCKTDSDCLDYQFCNKDNGKCMDQCAYMKCVNGCQKGKCLPPKPECTKDTECKSGQVCRNGKCGVKEIDVCSIINCKPGTRCEKGVCVPEGVKCKVTEECADPQVCLNGSCYNICRTTKCQGGYFCKHGNCFPEPIKCKSNADCGVGEKCWNGICQDKCVGFKCQKGFKCYQGACRPELCPKQPCPAGTFCKDNQCIPEVYVCPQKSDYKVTTCTDPRPNEKTCPVLYYIRAPDPLFTGVTTKGQYINFARDCQACKDKSVAYYFNKPSHELPFICEKQESCYEGYCSGRCSSDEECPYDWQMCLGGKCIDRCASMRCAAPCKYGQCGYAAPNAKCSSDRDCKNENLSCVAFKCVDLCLTKRCPANSTCKKGRCSPLA